MIYTGYKDEERSLERVFLEPIASMRSDWMMRTRAWKWTCKHCDLQLRQIL